MGAPGAARGPGLRQVEEMPNSLVVEEARGPRGERTTTE